MAIGSLASNPQPATRMTPDFEEDERVLRFHPYNILLNLTLGGITALFLAFSAAYLYTRVEMGIAPIKLPSLFFVNTLILLGSSYAMIMAKKAYLSDDTYGYQRSLIITLILSIIFLMSQLVAWQQLFGQEVFLTYNTIASYIYVISALHFVHVIAGLPFLILFLLAAYNRMKEPVSVLVYFSDPEKQLKLRLLTKYWHYLDGLWIYLVLFFSLNYLIR